MRDSNRTIWYIGQLFPGATSLSRLESLASAGFRTVPFNTNPYLRHPNRLTRAIAHRLHLGPLVRRLNRDLVVAANLLPTVDIVWIDKHMWIWPSTLRELRRRLKSLFVHYTPDPQLVFHKSRLFRASISTYDVIVTTKQYEIDKYRRLGARQLVVSDQGADDTFLYPELDFPHRPVDVVFVGHCEPHYAAHIKPLLATGATIRVFGNGWRRYCDRHSEMRNAFGGDSIYHDAYRKVLTHSKLGLGLLSKLAPDETTTRSFEIPACGTLLLSERTPALERCYTPGQEAAFFDSPTSLSAEVAALLADPERAQRIANNGYLRFKKSGYSTRSRIDEILSTLRLSP